MTPAPDPRRSRRRLRLLVGALLSVLGLLDSSRHGVNAAYIDPGFGAMLVQLASAALFGALFWIKGVRRQLARLFARLRGRETD